MKVEGISSGAGTGASGDPTTGRGPLLAVACWLALIPTLITIPYRFPPPEDAASAAATVGYGNAAAFGVAAVWALFVAGLFALADRRGWLGGPRGETSAPLDEQGAIWPEVAIAGSLWLLFYFPPFLARRGPFVEDLYFLTALHRMDHGLVPYRDLETLYGPLMLYLPHFSMKLFGGFSSVAYYVCLAALEVLCFGALFWLVSKYHRNRLLRWLVFGAIGMFLFNTLAGISWNGLRRLVPMLLLWNAAVAPERWPRIVLGGLGLGLLGAWSHDFGAFTVAGLGVMTLAAALESRSLRPFLFLAAQGIVAASTWLTVTLTLLGDAFSDYLSHAVYSAGRFGVESCFAFRWTGHSLITFAFLLLGFALAGVVFVRRGPLASGDRLLLGAVGFAWLALRSGLNRADMWHLATVTMPLLLYFLVPLPKNRAPDTKRLRQVSAVIIAMMWLTYTAALLPSGQYFSSGLARGAVDVLTGAPLGAPDMQSRAPTINHERTEVDPAEVELAAWLDRDDLRDRPVAVYQWLWSRTIWLGVRKIGYPTDDFLLADSYGEDLRELIDRTPDALVLIRPADHEWLLAGLRGEERELPVIWPDSVTKRILRWLSTIHYDGGLIELEQKSARWERTVGRWLAENWVAVRDFGDEYRVLARPTELPRTESAQTAP